MIAFHPQAQMKPITVRQALQNIEDIDGPELTDWLKKVGMDLKSGSFSYDEIAPLFKKYKGTTGGAMSTKFLFWDRCSCTLCKSEISCTGLIHPNKQRYLSIGEMKRLSSFPDVFQFIGKRSNAVERMGNSVPPKFMHAIAGYRCNQLLHASSEQEQSMPLDFIDKPINPSGPYKFTVISTFAGCGGSSLGYKWAGGKVLAAIEWDENAVATYRLNHHGTPVLHRDIATVTTQELLDLTGLQPGELDILDGSPPCQGFSTAGKRQIDDPRNSLFREYVRLLRRLQPKVFVMENVSGMVKGYMKHVFAIVMRELKASGYQVKCQLMNAMYFGVPQSRERVIFIGVRNDLQIEPSHPLGSSNFIPFGQIMEMGLPSDLSEIDLKRWQRIPQGGNFEDLPLSLRTKAKFSNTFRKLDSHIPSYTILKNDHFSGGFFHPTEPRRITIREKSRIASFPDTFQWIGKDEDVTARIGNSVPPRFMQAIAEHIYTHILSKVQQVQLLERVEEHAHA